MTINCHNYEEYFTLYLDNELNSDDRRMVEAFTQQHPDLKEELDLLTQYKLTPDTSIVFPGKEELMKVNDDTPVTFSNYEEWLVLYIDNELNPGQKDSVEQFIKANPSVKEEELFLSLATAWLDGLTRETSTIFGPENTCRLLDIFNNGKSE